MNSRRIILALSMAFLLSAGCSTAPATPPLDATPASTSLTPTASASPSEPSPRPSPSSVTRVHPTGLRFRLPADLTSSRQKVRMSVGTSSPRLEVVTFRRNTLPPLTVSLSEWPRADVAAMMDPPAFEARFSPSLTRLRLPGLKVSSATTYRIGNVRIVSKSATTLASRDGRVTHVQFIVALVRAPNGRAVLFVGDGAGPVEGPVDAILRSVRFD